MYSRYRFEGNFFPANSDNGKNIVCNRTMYGHLVFVKDYTFMEPFPSGYFSCLQAAVGSTEGTQM